MAPSRIAGKGAGLIGRVIRGEEKPLVSGRDGLAFFRIIEAVERAARDAIPVKVVY